MPEAIGESHEDGAANPGLDVLFRGTPVTGAEGRTENAPVRLEHREDRDLEQAQVGRRLVEQRAQLLDGFRLDQLRAAPERSGDPWLDAIAGKKHKAFLDVSYFVPDGGPFRRTRALMATLKQSYGAADTDIGVAFGAHSSALGYLLTPAAWDEPGLAELLASRKWLAPILGTP